MSIEYRKAIDLGSADGEISPDVQRKQPDIHKLEDIADTLIVQQAALEAMRQRLRIDKPACVVAYVPETVLVDKPTADQVRLFNRDNTDGVAAYSVDIQRRLEKVPIVELGERLVYLPELLENNGIRADFSAVPFHEACGEWAGKERQFWAREAFADRLLYMAALLNRVGVMLRFEDVFRPAGVQEGLFKRRVAWTKRDNPDWNNQRIIAEAQSKTAVKPRLASHKAGAAADARIVNEHTGRVMDFGHEYPDGGALVFPQTSFITEDQWLNRQMFQIAAGLSGLTLYVGEDWHVSYGDNLASLNSEGVVDKDYVAKYGPIKEYDHKTGEIISGYDEDELDKTFDF